MSKVQLPENQGCCGLVLGGKICDFIRSRMCSISSPIFFASVSFPNMETELWTKWCKPPVHANRILLRARKMVKLLLKWN